MPNRGTEKEAVHAMIKRCGSAAPKASPPYIISKVRESQTLDLVRKSSAFREYVVSTWNSTTMLGDLLRLRCSTEELRQMGRTKRIQTIYQCTMESSHGDTSAQLPSRNVHLALTLRDIADVPLLPKWKAVVAYLENVFFKGSFFS